MKLEFMSKVKSYAALSEKTPLEPYNIIRRECNSDDVLIKIEYCGVCHSDIHMARNEWNNTSIFPMVPGHEIIGEEFGYKKTKSDFSWVDISVFDGSGFPIHERGVTQSPGLYFLGLPWLYTWGSGRFCGVKDDANFLADIISLRSNKSAATKEMLECKALLGS